MLNNSFSKILKIDLPGFIIEDFTKLGRNTILRVVFLPEGFFINMEKSINPKILYMIGKKFSYYYSQLSNLPNIKKMSEKKFYRFC